MNYLPVSSLRRLLIKKGVERSICGNVGAEYALRPPRASFFIILKIAAVPIEAFRLYVRTVPQIDIRQP